MTTTPALTTDPRALQEELERLRAEVAAWRARFDGARTRDIAFANSGGEVAPLYTALDTLESPAATEVPGRHPFTRGIHPTGYRRWDGCRA